MQRFLDRVKVKRRVKLDGTPESGLQMEKELLGYFLQAEAQKLSEPCVIVDVHGYVLVWYLPRILSPSRTVSAASLLMSRTLTTSYVRGT
jgi:hypothetical protein